MNLDKRIDKIYKKLDLMAQTSEGKVSYSRLFSMLHTAYKLGAIRHSDTSEVEFETMLKEVK